MKGFDDQVLTGRILVVWNEWCTEVTVRIWKVIYSFLLLATDVGNWPLQFYWCRACVIMLEIDSIPAPFSLVKVDHRTGDRKPEAEHHHISKAKPFKKEGLFNINKAILFGMLMPLCIPLWASTWGFEEPNSVTAQLILSNVQRTCLCFPVQFFLWAIPVTRPPASSNPLIGSAQLQLPESLPPDSSQHFPLPCSAQLPAQPQPQAPSHQSKP